jgi:hypothetical protein
VNPLKQRGDNVSELQQLMLSYRLYAIVGNGFSWKTNLKGDIFSRKPQ